MSQKKVFIAANVFIAETKMRQKYKDLRAMLNTFIVLRKKKKILL